MTHSQKAAHSKRYRINEKYPKSNAKRSLNISLYQDYPCLGEAVLPNQL
jgi:hypothetical protein